MKHLFTKLLTFCLILICSFPNLQTYAAEYATITEKYVEEDTVVLYVSGIEGEVSEISYQIGNTACEVLEYKTIQKMDDPIYTLILWDNSISVMKNYSSSIKEVLIDIIANRAQGEKFSIATLEKDITVLSEYTNDYTVLKQSVNSVEAVNKSVYIIENLYNCLKNFQEMEDCSYKRIILVSDGSGDEGTGYTKTELEALLTEYSCPIYTIGVGKDEAGLQYMFSLSRMTGADSFHLDELEDKLQVSQKIAEQYDTLQIKVKMPEEVMDGSTRNSKVSVTTDRGAFSTECQVKLPFLSEVSGAEQSVVTPTTEPTAEPTIEPSPEPTAAPTKAPEATVTQAPDNSAKESEEKDMSLSTGIVIALFGVAILAVIVAIICIVLKKRKNTGESWNVNKNDSTFTEEYELTEKLDDEPTMELDEDLTQDLSEVNYGFRFQLSEVSDPAVMYRCPVSAEKVVIGRKAESCNLVIPSDKTVSGIHCEVYRKQQYFYVKDAGSTNGTFVDGKRIFDETEIKNGSILKLGNTEYKVTIG